MRYEEDAVLKVRSAIDRENADEAAQTLPQCDPFAPVTSAQPCGCDPGCKVNGSWHICEHWPCCDYGHSRVHCAIHFIEDGRDKPSVQTMTEAQKRKQYPVITGCFDYFPDALMEVALVSKMGNDQHNPGQPLHWDRTKSTDEIDALGRHLIDRGTRDTDGMRHSAKVAWRALANLQKEIEADAAA